MTEKETENSGRRRRRRDDAIAQLSHTRLVILRDETAVSATCWSTVNVWITAAVLGGLLNPYRSQERLDSMIKGPGK